MANDDRARIIARRTPESAAMLANVKRATAITAILKGNLRHHPMATRPIVDGL
jgi:hypothetical protein